MTNTVDDKKKLVNIIRKNNSPKVEIILLKVQQL